MTKIALIAVEAATFAIDKPYSYAFNPSMELFIGCRVLVPFGRGNKISEGIVLGFDFKEDISNLKTVFDKLDDAPMISAQDIKLAFWMRQRYFCTFFDAIHTILPSAVWFQYKKTWYVNNNILTDSLSTQEKQFIEFLEDGKDYNSLEKKFGPICERIIKNLEKKKAISCQVSSSHIVNDKSIKYASLICSMDELDSYISSHKRSKKMNAVLGFLKETGKATCSDVIYFTGTEMSCIRRLEQLGLLSITEEESYRLDDLSIDADINDIVLNSDQNTAYQQILDDIHSNNSGVNLLFGVTGSGKTQIYLKLAQTMLQENRSAMILVPEIALTPQMMGLFASYFGNEVALLHSGLRLTERFDQWKRIKKGEAHIVLGTRSAVFAPLSNIGFIAIDEEQEPSYESEKSPTYQTRDIAKYRCACEKSRLILGSATPTVESFYYASKGEYKLHTLTHRYNKKSLPKVMIADMRQELRDGNIGTLSKVLIDEIQKNIENHEQTILFLNRRGNSHQLLCPQCGYVPECPRCSVKLTYHSKNHRMMCHYCGYSSGEILECPECHTKLLHLGAGTQKIEEELNHYFTNIPVLRMDSDTISEGHEKIFNEFVIHKVPILLGTQMVAKGLNFENVTLVGVLSADQNLYVDHFSASERTFNLITQVIGRAGRCEKEGRAVIQTYSPNNVIIHSASLQDYFSFYNKEIEMRELRNEPPFFDQFVITISGENELNTFKVAVSLKQGLENSLYSHVLRVLGPSQTNIFKVNNRFRYRITIIGKNTRQVRDVIAFYKKEFSSMKQAKNMTFSVDCNRMN